jgi:transposase-like protein
MSVQRKRYSAEEKTRVVIEAIRGQKTANEIASDYHRPSLAAYYDEDFE